MRCRFTSVSKYEVGEFYTIFAYSYLSSDLRKDVAICELPRLFSFTEQDFILPYHKTFPKPFGKIESAVVFKVRGKVQQKRIAGRDIE